MKSLQEDIRSGNFKHVYLLYGEEAYLVEQYRDRLRDALAAPGDTMNVTVFEGKNIDPKELTELADTLPFFAERRVILVGNSGFFKRNADELADYLAKIPESAYFVFREEEVDRRGKLFRQVKKYGRAVEFKRQTDAVLMQWVLGRLKKEGKKITRPVMELFLSKTGDDMLFIVQELEKLLCYTMNREVIEAADVEAVCSDQIAGKIFQMVDAIGKREQRQALDLYHDLLALREPSLRILYLIIRQFRILMRLKEMEQMGFDHKGMASMAGVPEFAVRKYLGQARKFSGEQLEHAVKEGVAADEQIKTGQIAERLAVELLIVRFSKV